MNDEVVFGVASGATRHAVDLPKSVTIVERGTSGAEVAWVRMATRMLGVVDEWAAERSVERMMLGSRPRARTLYERVGFEMPAEKHIHRDGPFSVRRGTTNGELT